MYTRKSNCKLAADFLRFGPMEELELVACVFTSAVVAPEQQAAKHRCHPPRRQWKGAEQATHPLRFCTPHRLPLPIRDLRRGFTHGLPQCRQSTLPGWGGMSRSLPGVGFPGLTTSTCASPGLGAGCRAPPRVRRPAYTTQCALCADRMAGSSQLASHLLSVSQSTITLALFTQYVMETIRPI